MSTMTNKQKDIMEQKAKELIRIGNHLEISHGNGMMEVIDSIKEILKPNDKEMTDGELLDEVYKLLTKRV